MSVYVVSDLHGCHREFNALLTGIDFSDYDELWILGDVCDRGPDSIGLYQQIMQHDNMHLILGNHDAWFLKYMDTLIAVKKGQEITLPDADMRTWLFANGGTGTADAYMDLDLPACYDLKAYLEQAPFYQELEVRGQKYVLVHAGMGADCPAGTLISAVDPHEMLWSHIGLEDNPYSDRTLIVGHMPTFFYGHAYDGKIAHGRKKSILHIDCGCVYGRPLGCVRLNDGKEFYIPSTHTYLEVS